MYKKIALACFLFQAVLLTAALSVQGVNMNKIMVSPAFQTEKKQVETLSRRKVKEMSSGQRVIQLNLLEAEEQEIAEQVIARSGITQEDYHVLLRIVEAEAGGEDENGKLLVANVVLNRVEDEAFPDTIKEVVFQQENGVTQFSPIRDGRFEQVTVSEETIKAVNRALCGEDISQGALYFAARKSADPERMRWFDEKLEFLFCYGGHEFFQPKIP